MKKLLFSMAVLAISVCVSATNPCGKYKTDANRFVADGVGHATHLNTAKIKAQMDANAKLTDDILLWIKSLTDQYILESNLDPAQYSSIFDLISQQKVEGQIDHASIICDKKGRVNNDMLTAYITLELDRRTILEISQRAFAADKRLSGVYDKDKFSALCKAHMDGLKKK